MPKKTTSKRVAKVASKVLKDKRYIACGLAIAIPQLTGSSVFSGCNDWYCESEYREQPHIHNEVPHPQSISSLDSTFTVSALATTIDEKTAKMVRLNNLF